jgi:hypothetical protein
MSMDLEERLLARIEQEHIRPYPKWVGVLMKLGSHLSMGAALLCSTLAASVFFLWLGQGLDRGPQQGFRWVMIGLLPWFSLVSAVLLSWIGWRLFRRTGTGYRRQAWMVVLVFFAVSASTGYVLQATGGLFRIHRAMATTSDTYREFFQGRRSLEWSLPEEGRLAGVVTTLDSAGIELRDPQGKTWQVHSAVPDWVAVGLEVRLEGAMGQDRQFLATRIDRFGPGGGGKMGHGKRHSEEKKECKP